nr:hypothetical protein [Halosimplex aquaticum]
MAQMAHHDRRTFLRAIGLGTTGVLASNYAADAVAAATTITIEGGGYDIWNARDEFHYYYTEVDGDFDVSVRVDSLENTDPWARAGLMVRQTLNDDAEHAMIRKTPGNDTSFQWRSDDGNDAESTTSGGTGESEVSGGTMSATWQRLVRSGDTIEAYGSSDGENWTLIADISPGEIDLADSAYVGLAVCSHNEGTLTTAQFSNLSGLSPGSNEDVGNVEVAGSVSTGTGGGGDTDPVVSTGSASSVGTSSATLSGALDDLGGASSADAYFEWRESGASSWTATSAQTLSSTGSYSQTVSGLSAGTDHEFRAAADASDGDAATGSANTFSTSASGGGDTDPVVSTGSASSVDASSATLSGSLDDLGGASSADVSFEYRESGASSWNATSAQTLSSSGSVSTDVSGLSSGTSYEFRVTASASDGDSATGSVSSFTTSSGSGGTSGGSYFDYEDGFADVSWFDDSVQVIRIQEAALGPIQDAFTTEGPRLIVFETSGVVDLGGADLSITYPNCWVAGQTAPSPGITFINGMVQVEPDNCIVQHIRVFRGDESGGEGTDPLNNRDGSSNVIFDHCTSYWGRDENLSVGYDSTDTTVSNCLVAEGLENPEENSNGTLVGDGASNVAILGTVYAKNNDRNPRLKSNTETVVVNGLNYYFDKAIWIDGGASAAVEGNAYIGRFDWSDAIVFGDGSVSFADNLVTDPGLEGRAFQNVGTELSSRPLWPGDLSPMPSSEVESHNLNYAGARPADRISHEQRVVDEIRNRSLNTDVSDPADSDIPNSHTDVGGYPDHGGTTHTLNVPSSGLRSWLDQWALAVEEENASPP